MSKFLKFIVNIVFIGAILCSLAMLIPPLLGIKTTIIDEKTYTETNMLKGCVTYSMPVEATQLGMRDEIVVENGRAVNRYTVVSVDTSKEECCVKRSSAESYENNQNATENISIKSGAYKYLFCVEYIGYLLIATQSQKGRIALGVAAGVLIILFILSEIWKKKPEKKSKKKSERNPERQPERKSSRRTLESEEEILKTPKELKREEKRKAKLRKEEEKIMLEEERERKKEAKRKKKNATVRTGGFVDEIDEEDEYYVPDDVEIVEQPSAEQRLATSEAHEELKKEIAAVTATAMQERQEIESRFTSTKKIKPVKEEAQKEPDIEEPAIEEPMMEETIVEEEMIEEPVIEEPVIEEPMIEQPVIEEPVIEEAVIEESVIEETVIEEPAEEPEEDIFEEDPIVTEPAETLPEEVFEEVMTDAEEPVEAAEITENEETEELPEASDSAHSIEELVKKAKESGETPDILQDEVSNVVLFDYSDIITSDDYDE